MASRKERMNAIFESKKTDQEKMIEYQQTIVEELAWQNVSLVRMFVAGQNKKLEATRAPQTREQLKQAAEIDLNYFTMAYKACPTCGRGFDKMHPMENLYPHWTGACAAREKAGKP